MSHLRLVGWAGVAAAALLLAAPVAAAQPVPAASIRVDTLDGRQIDPFAEAGARGIVFIFVRTDCPVANRYAPEIERLHQDLGDRGIAVRLVYVDPAASAEAVRVHLRDYRYHIVAFRDPDHALVEYAGARVTPEAAVFTPERRLVYRGRIDNRYVEVTRARRIPTQRDLREVLVALAGGREVTPRTTEAVGCFIADLK